MDFMIGCNYWDGVHGTNMWRDFDEDVIRADVEALAKTGVRFMRVFPNWRDFQPMMKMYEWQGGDRGYYDYDEQYITDPNGIDQKQIENFKTFANICKENGIGLCVSVLTGWMSGRQFVPRAIEGKNPISDPEALMLASMFIRGFVNGVKDCENIVMWDLGNECNSLGPAKNRYEAFTWTAFVRNAIAAADPTRKISSGMHGLSSGGGIWTIKDQGAICDYLTPHPYISRTINNDIDPMNKLRSTLIPTAQCVFYADISGKPAILQEQGAFSQSLANAEMNADFERVNIFSALVHSIKGYFWWCGANHNNLKNAPYIWSMVERDLGLLDDDRNPKPIADAMKAAGDRIDALPFDELPPRDMDGICLLTRENNRWDNASAAFVLAKQAGIELKFAECEDALEKAGLYVVPGIAGWSVMDKRVWDALLENVYDGATAVLTFAGAQMARFEEVTGLRSNGIIKSNARHTAHFDFGDIDYTCTAELVSESIGAEVLARNEQGNIVLSRNKLGKGYVYLLNMPLESTLAVKYNAFNSDCYKIYSIFAKPFVDRKIASSANPNLGVTQHKTDDGKYIIAVINYGDKTEACDLKVADGWKLTCVDGNGKEITKCDAAFFIAERSSASTTKRKI